MRNRIIIAAAALLLASAFQAGAQTPAVAPATPSWVGNVDFGLKTSDVEGDRARFERYRDMRNGTDLGLFVGREASSYMFEATARNIGTATGATRSTSRTRA